MPTIATDATVVLACTVCAGTRVQTIRVRYRSPVGQERVGLKDMPCLGCDGTGQATAAQVAAYHRQFGPVGKESPSP